jgi:hypothetical protein
MSLLREYIKEILNESIEFRTLDSPLKYSRASDIKRIALCDTSVEEPHMGPTGKPLPTEILMSPATEKARHATTGDVPNVLIDDKPSTVDAWNDAGGVGILHSPGGSAATVRQLQELGL